MHKNGTDYSVMFALRDRMVILMPHMDIKDISVLVHAINHVAPGVDGSDFDALMDALHLVGMK